MKNMTNKSIAMIISVALVITSIPLFSWAANDTADDITVDETVVDAGGVVLTKSVTQEADENGEYTISLETYTTGTVTTTTESTPTDIILVIDQSASMYHTFEGEDIGVEDAGYDSSVEQADSDYELTRQYALMNAVNDFIDEVNADAAAQNDADFYHSISIVAFSSAYGDDEQPDNEGIYGNTDVYVYGSDTNNATANDAYVSLTGAETDDDGLEAWLAALDADRGTPADAGMEEALAIYEDSDSYESEDRNQIVILFTDGSPKDATATDFEIDRADAAIDAAYDFKTSGATVYTIGIFDDADPSYITGSGVTDTYNGNTGVGSTWNVEDNAYGNAAYDGYINNRFMNFVSSNAYVTGDDPAMDLGIEENEGGNRDNYDWQYEITDEYDWEQSGYFLTADNAEDLSNIFSSISSQIIASEVSLGTSTQVQDYVSSYFEMPEGFTADDVSLSIVDYSTDGVWDTENATTYDFITGYTYSYTDYTGDEPVEKEATLSVVYDEATKGVTVEGFDYDAHLVTETNQDSSGGTYYGSKLVISFNITAIDGFIGGNDVPTNTSLSGIYTPLIDSETGDELDYYNSLESFGEPDTQVELEYTLSTQDQTVYLGNRIDLYKILQINGHDVLGVSNEYVDITFYIYEEGYLDTLDTEEPNTDEAIAEFIIPAGMSADDAANLEVNQPLENITPAESTTYDVYCVVTSQDPEDVDLDVGDEKQYSLSTTVYVLQAQVEGTDIWVDYGARVNLRLDGTTPISWVGLDYGDTEVDLYNANADYAPTVYYIYQNTVTGEYLKAQYQVDWNNDGDYDDTVTSVDADGNTIEVPETGPDVGTEVTVTTWDGIDITYTVVADLDINIESEEQYKIVAMQTLSSDGYNIISYWSADSDVYQLEETGDITDDNVMNVYLNEYAVDVTKTVVATAEEWASYQQSFIFELSQTAYDYTEDLEAGATSDGTATDNDGTEHEITYRDPYITEVVMSPSEFTVSTEANEDDEYTYTCTKTVSNLLAGLETVITEDTDWSWRYDLTETSVDTTLEEGTLLDTDVILTEPITLNADTTLSAESTLATGSILATGTTINNITLPEGSQIATDVILSDDTTGHVFLLPVILSADTEIGDDGANGTYTAQIGATLAAGTTFVEAVSINGTQYSSGDVLATDVTLTAEVTLSAGTILGEGSVILQANQLPNGTKIPAGTALAADVTITDETTLDVGVIISEDTVFTIGTVLAAGTILTEGTTLPDDIIITSYGTLSADIVDNVITVNYSHTLYTTGYGNDEMGLDTNKNGFNDTIVDITGDSIPDTQAFVYRDRNNDSYTDIDVLAPYVTEDEVTDEDYTNFDIAFDLDNDDFIDLIVSADAAGDDGRRLITASMTYQTNDYFVGFYINEDGNIETSDGTLIFNRQTKYFDGYFVYATQDDTDESYGLIVGGNGGIYSATDSDDTTDYSGSGTTFYIVSAGGIGTDGQGYDYSDAGISDVVIEDENGNTYYGTGLVIIADPVNLEIFNRDGIDGNDLEALPLLIRNTYRYINSNEYLVFTGEYDRDDDGVGDPPADGQIDTFFTNELDNEQWLSFDTVVENVFDAISAITAEDDDYE